MAKEINPFLMFVGDAEKAMNFYMSLFPASKVESLTRYGAENPAAGNTKKSQGSPPVCYPSGFRHGALIPNL